LASLVKQPIVVDTRNLLDPDVLRHAGFTWTGVGRNHSSFTSPTPQ
jgi:UDPglucose 6-dehydrogenase